LSQPADQLIYLLYIFREITLKEFRELLKVVAPKHQKDKQLDSVEAAVSAMIETINSQDPALHGTTVRYMHRKKAHRR